MRLPQFNIGNPANVQTMTAALKRAVDPIVTQLNSLSESKLSARNNAFNAAPTGGTYAVGDFVPNSAIAVLGDAGSQYVLTGWVCVTAPLTFVECRCLTGT